MPLDEAENMTYLKMYLPTIEERARDGLNGQNWNLCTFICNWLIEIDVPLNDKKTQEKNYLQLQRIYMS